MASHTYEVVIIGGGTTGVIIATRLSEDPALQVAVLESGEDESSNPNVSDTRQLAAAARWLLGLGFQVLVPGKLLPV
jgi:choline dehydrogenase-like flavoprotein